MYARSNQAELPAISVQNFAIQPPVHDSAVTIRYWRLVKCPAICFSKYSVSDSATGKEQRSEIKSSAKISEDDRNNIETAIEGVEAAMKENDKDAIDTATTKLTEAAQVIYEQAAAQAQAEAEGAEGSAKAAADDVVDAGFFLP